MKKTGACVTDIRKSLIARLMMNMLAGVWRLLLLQRSEGMLLNTAALLMTSLLFPVSLGSCASAKAHAAVSWSRTLLIPLTRALRQGSVLHPYTPVCF